MSLYSGISFKADESSQPESAGGSSSSNPGSSVGGGGDTKKNWSSALAFAPTRRAPPAKLKPPRASAALFFTPPPGVASGAQPTDAVRSAEPVLRPRSTAGDPTVDNPTPAEASSSTQPPPTTAQATRALPSLTVDDEAGRSRKRPAPQRAADDDGKKKKKKNKRRRGGEHDSKHPTFDAAEPYDPTKPNDVEVYLRWRDEQRREKERARRDRQVRRSESEGESSEGSYYSEDERDEAVTSTYRGGFAPPSSYNEPITTAAPASAAYAPPAMAVAVPADLTGDEAYARRVALSTGRATALPAPVAPAEPTAPRAPPTGPRGYGAAAAAPISSVAASIQERIHQAQMRSAVPPTHHSMPPSHTSGSGGDTSCSGWNHPRPVHVNSAEVGQSSFGPSSQPPAAPPVDPRIAQTSLPPVSSAPPPSWSTDPRLSSATPTPPPGAVPRPPSRPLDPRLAVAAPSAHSSHQEAPPSFASAAQSPAWSSAAFPPQPHQAPAPPQTLLNPTADAFTSHAMPPSSTTAQQTATSSLQGDGPGPASSSAADDFQRKLEEKKAAAAAIAARFAKPPSFGGLVPGTNQTLVGTSSAPSDKLASQDEDTRDFATRLMAKWGYQEGQGLGVNAEGITKPIEVVQTKHVRPPASSTFEPDGGGRTRGPPAMGKIVSETTARKEAEDRARFGDSSRVITLEHLVGGLEEVDGDLSEEIAVECGKHGIVERVVVHERSPVPPQPEDAVVIFVVFSGPAGAYEAIRALNDRFFGGRQVVAKYFSEARFARGDRQA